MKIPLLALFLVVLTHTHAAHSEEWTSEPFLVAKGTAEIDVPPERATVTLYVTSFEKESEAAVSIVQEQITRVLEVFESFDIPANAIESHSLRKNVERKRENHRDLEILGYTVSRRISADLEDLAQFSELVAALANLENVSRVTANFDVQDREDFEARLTRLAAEDARRKAENMASAMGVSLGDVRAISETEFRYDGTIYGLSEPYLMVESARPYEDTVFQPATIAIRQSLNVVFLIEQ